jgi:mono/diheme cytochrome c family protein
MISMRVITTLVVSAALAATLGAQGAQQHEHPAGGGEHRHMDAAKNKNPVKADATSIAAGKQLYEKQCAACHGETGKGDGKMAAQVPEPKPSNLSDAEWKHGSTDGELYLVIHDGSKNTAMKPYASKLTEHQIWDVINYVRTLGPTKSH